MRGNACHKIHADSKAISAADLGWARLIGLDIADEVRWLPRMASLL